MIPKFSSPPMCGLQHALHRRDPQILRFILRREPRPLPKGLPGEPEVERRRGTGQFSSREAMMDSMGEYTRCLVRNFFLPSENVLWALQWWQSNMGPPGPGEASTKAFEEIFLHKNLAKTGEHLVDDIISLLLKSATPSALRSSHAVLQPVVIHPNGDGPGYAVPMVHHDEQQNTVDNKRVRALHHRTEELFRALEWLCSMEGSERWLSALSAPVMYENETEVPNRLFNPALLRLEAPYMSYRVMKFLVEKCGCSVVDPPAGELKIVESAPKRRRNGPGTWNLLKTVLKIIADPNCSDLGFFGKSLTLDQQKLLQAENPPFTGEKIVSVDFLVPWVVSCTKDKDPMYIWDIDMHDLCSLQEMPLIDGSIIAPIRDSIDIKTRVGAVMLWFRKLQTEERLKMQSSFRSLGIQKAKDGVDHVDEALALLEFHGWDVEETILPALGLD